MAQNFAFLPYGATTLATVGGAAGPGTITVNSSTTGIPPLSVRFWNAGTALAFIMMDTATGLTVTGGLANGMPVPQSCAPFVLRTGGATKVQFGSTGTITTTIYATAGEGID